MPAQANESSATQSPAVGNCQCQLMIYDPASPGFDPGEDFYQTPQSQIPPHFTEILAPIDTRKIHHGRFLLWNPYVENAPELPLEDWIIEAVDSQGRPVNNVLRFALYDVLSSGPAPQWGPRLVQGPTPCEAYVRFQFKVAEATTPLDDYYWIRAKWPRTAPDEQAVVCLAKVKFREEQRTPGSGGEETIAPPAPQIIFLQNVIPPGSGGIGGIAMGQTVIPGGTIGRCSCQLIAWSSENTEGIPDIETTTAQSEVPERFRNLTVERGTAELRGRYNLSDPAIKDQTTQSQRTWRIEALDERERRVDSFEFRILEGVPAPDSGWANILEGKTICSRTIQFEWRVLPSARAGEYTLRARWAADLNEHLDCELTVTVTARCSNALVLLPDFGSVDGYIHAIRAGEEDIQNEEATLGGCLERHYLAGVGVSARFAATPETLALQLDFDGPLDREMNYSLTCEAAEIRGAPLEFLPIDGPAKADGTREMGEAATPRGAHGWRDKYTSRSEPCGAEPIRFLARVNRNPTILSRIAQHFTTRGADGQVANPLAVTIRLFASRLTPEENPEKTVTVYIALTGGLQVEGHGLTQQFGNNVMRALRQVAGPGSNVDFDWVGGSPKGGESRWIMPTRAFCSGGRPEDRKGRELLWLVLCGGCCVTVRESASIEHYNPYFAGHAFPQGAEPAGKAPRTWMIHPGVGASGTIRKGAIIGTGLGTGGWVYLDSALMSAGTKNEISAWERGTSSWVKAGSQPFSAPRFLAHEFAHAVFACEGNLRIAMPIPAGPDFDDNFDGLPWSAQRAAFQDWGEYDAVINWENPIALELGERPRFNKPG